MAEKKSGKKKSNTSKEKVLLGKKRMHWSLLTFVLLICIVELIISNMQNINKNIIFTGKIKGLEEKRNEEYIKNRQLKSEISNFDSAQTIQSIARNNLKMAERDEILVIINKKKDSGKTQNRKRDKEDNV